MLVHGLWDLSLFSPSVGADPDSYVGTLLPIVAQVVLIVVVLPRRRRVEPVPGVGVEPTSP